MIKKTLLLCYLVSVYNMQLYAQGCSDAGFCSAGNLKGGHAMETVDTPQHSVGFTFIAGSGEKGTMVYIPQVELQFALKKNRSVEIKLPYNIANGDLGSHSGLGDIIATYSGGIKQKHTSLQLNYSLGLRIGTGQADAKDANGNPLPMVYQNSLGTTDIIAGLHANYKKYLNVAVGYQQPIFQYNHNGYYIGDYFPARELKRKGDVLLRIEGQYNWKHCGIAAGPLFIYHLGKDKVTVPDYFITPTRTYEVELNGSEGLTLNMAISGYYQWQHCRLDITAGEPFVVRDVRPDGLTREWVIAPKFTYFFGKH